MTGNSISQGNSKFLNDVANSSSKSFSQSLIWSSIGMTAGFGKSE
jgi:hypothetical protein